MSKEITVPVPLVLQMLVRSNNQLLKNYQNKLMAELEEANSQLMSMLQLNPDAGWVLDLERMVYARIDNTENVINESIAG